MFDKQTLLVIKFFQKAFQVAGEVESDPAKYLNKFRSSIKAIGRLFEYLKLAKPDKKSALGWKPAKRLLDLIAKGNYPSKRTTNSASIMEPFVLGLMFDTMLGVGDDPYRHDCFCSHVLMMLGLVFEDDIGDRFPTPALADLFLDTYCIRVFEKLTSDPDAVYQVVPTGK
jgi:hypothetical protein